MQTDAPFTSYLVDEPIPQSIIRQRLNNNVNKLKRADYNIKDGPFSQFAILGEKFRKKYVRFGARPPSGFRIETDLSYEQVKTIQNNIAKNKAKLLKLFSEHGQQKFWQLARRLCDASPSQPPVVGLIDQNNIAQMSESGIAKTAVEHLKPLY